MKRKRKSKAKNKLQGSLDGSEASLIKAEPERSSDAPAVVLRATPIATVRRSTMFSAELEEAIELIARERVYRAMLAGLGRRLLMAPPPAEHDDANRR